MKRLFVELADDSLKRELGLMNRKTMSSSQGMLFKFPSAHHLSFWMQNTYLPLDIAFLDDDGIILQISEMVPLSTRPVRSSTRCRYALEVNRGWFKKNKIGEGSQIAGFGLEGLSKKFAQGAPPEGLPPQEGLVEEPIPEPTPDVYLNQSFQQMLEKASRNDQDLIIYYQKKDGYTLGPKSISPPFLFEPDEDGRVDNVVKGWDNEEGQWKSFRVDHIMDLEAEEEDYALYVPRALERPLEKNIT